MKEKPTVISFVSGKGGASKTTATTNISVCLKKLGFSSLVVDADKQGNASKALNAFEVGRGLANVLSGADPRQFIKKSSIKNIDVLPSDYESMDKISKVIDGEVGLLNKLEGLNEYDFILIDCPPNLDDVVENVLAISDYVVVPVIADSNAIDGLGYIVKKTNSIREVNSKLNILGIFLSHDDGSFINKEIKMQLKEAFGDKFFDTSIAYSKFVPRSTFDENGIRKPVTQKYPLCKASKDYLKLATEIIDKIVDKTER